MQKKLFDIGWLDEGECQTCHKEEGTEKHRLYHCPEWYEVILEISEAFRKWEQKERTSKEWKWQRGIVTHCLSESQWNRGHFRMKKWESEKHKSRVELDHDEDLGPRCMGCTARWSLSSKYSAPSWG